MNASRRLPSCIAFFEGGFALLARWLGLALIGIAAGLPGTASAQTPVTAKVVTGRHVDFRMGTDTWTIAPTSAAALSRIYGTPAAGVTNTPSAPWTGTIFYSPDGVNRDNKVRPGQTLRVAPSGAPVGSVLHFTATSAQRGALDISITVTESEAQLVSLTRLDPMTTKRGLLRWEAVFSAPVAGVSPENFQAVDNASLSPAPVIASVEPSSPGDGTRHLVTVQVAGYGRGQVSVAYMGYAQESPAVWNTATGAPYNVDTLTFGIAPGGSVYLVAPQRWSFDAGPSPAGSAMARFNPTLTASWEWGTIDFQADPNNQRNHVYAAEYLQVRAGSVSSGRITVGFKRTFGSGSSGIDAVAPPIYVDVATPPAQVVAMNILDPSPTVAESVRWEVVFDKAVANVTADNFGFINPASITPAPQVLSALPKPGAGNVRWIVTAATPGKGVGLLALRWAGSATESPAVPYAFFGQCYDFSFYPNVVQDLPTGTLHVALGTAPTLHVLFENRADELIHYQWKRGTSQNPLAATNVGTDSPDFTPTLPAPGLYQFFCRGYTNSESGYYRDSSTATIRVLTPATITAQPTAPALVESGASVTLSVAASGDALAYQWYRGPSGDTSAPVAGATSPSFTTPALTERTSFWVRVSNPLGSAYQRDSEAATVSVVGSMVFGLVSVAPVVDSTLSNLKVRTFDPQGAALADVPVTFTISAAGVVGGSIAGGSFSGVTYVPGALTASATANASGVVTMPAMWTNTKTGAYRVVANFGSISAELRVINAAGPPANAVMTSTWPTALVAGAAFGATLQLRDAWANLITDTGLGVTGAVADGTSSALRGTLSASTVNGVATFSNLIYTRAERFSVAFTCGDARYVTPLVPVSAAEPSLLLVTAGNGQTVPPGAAFPTVLRVRLNDAYGNAVGGRTVSFSAPASGATATLSATSVPTDNQGRAEVSATAGPLPGAYAVTANISPALGGPATFYLANFNALQSWRAANFNGVFENTGNAANTAAPFGEGVPNLLKYAFNLNAQAPDATPMTPAGTKGLPLVGTDASGRLTLTFVRRKASTSPAITYLPVFGDDFQGGSFAANPAATTAVVSLDATWERVTVTDSVVPTAQLPRRFACVQIAEP